MLSLMTTEARKRTVSTPWGAAEVVDEVKVAQRAPEKRFSVVVQLLSAPGGEPLVRIAYATEGTIRRGPVTMRAREVERLRTALEGRPALADVVRLLGGEAG
jgi:hypothetical protein